MSYIYTANPNELYHYGVMGMKWGVRKDRYSSSKNKGRVKLKTKNKLSKQQKAKIKKYAKVGAAVAVTGLAAYGGYKLYKTRQVNKALIGKFIENNGYIPVRRMTSYESMRFKDRTSFKKRTYKQDTIKKSLLGPTLTRRTETKSFVPYHESPS